MLKLFVIMDKTFKWVDLMKIDKYLAAFEYTWNLSEVITNYIQNYWYYKKFKRFNFDPYKWAHFQMKLRPLYIIFTILQWSSIFEICIKLYTIWTISTLVYSIIKGIMYHNLEICPCGKRDISFTLQVIFLLICVYIATSITNSSRLNIRCK